MTIHVHLCAYVRDAIIVSLNGKTLNALYRMEAFNNSYQRSSLCL